MTLGCDVVPLSALSQLYTESNGKRQASSVFNLSEISGLSELEDAVVDAVVDVALIFRAIIIIQ